MQIFNIGQKYVTSVVICHCMREKAAWCTMCNMAIMKSLTIIITPMYAYYTAIELLTILLISHNVVCLSGNRSFLLSKSSVDRLLT